jgi:hypothetical protein
MFRKCRSLKEDRLTCELRTNTNNKVYVLFDDDVSNNFELAWARFY